MFLVRVFLCTCFTLLFSHLSTAAELNFDSTYRGNSASLYQDLANAVNDAVNGDTIVFNSNVTIPFDQQLDLEKAVNFKGQNNSVVVFDGQHKSRIFRIFGVESNEQSTGINDLPNIAVEGITFQNANSVSDWEHIAEDLTKTPVTYDELTDTWSSGDRESVFGTGSKYTVNPEGGAVYAEFVNLEFKNCKFLNNYSTIAGAAVFLFNGSLDFKNSEISGNMCTSNQPHSKTSSTPSLSGGIIFQESKVIPATEFSITNSKIEKNYFKSSEGGLSTRGGIIFSSSYNQEQPGKFELSHNVVALNKCIFRVDDLPLIQGLFIYKVDIGRLAGTDTISNNNIYGNTRTGALSNGGHGGIIRYYKPAANGNVLNVFNNSICNNNPEKFPNGAVMALHGSSSSTAYFYNNTIIKNGAGNSSIFIVRMQGHLHGNIFGFNGTTYDLELVDSLFSGSYNYVEAPANYVQSADDLSSTLTEADLSLLEIFDENHENPIFYIPDSMAFSPLVDAAPIPVDLPANIDLSTDLLENAFSGLNRDIGAVDALSTFNIYSSQGVIGGTVTPNNTRVIAGSNKLITVVPDPGYALAHLRINGQPIAVNPEGMTYLLTDIQENTIISANFELMTNVVYLDEGRWNSDLQAYEFDNGSIAAIPEAGPYPSFIEVPHGENQSFRISADEFYLINSIRVINLNSGEVDEVIPVTNLYTMDVTLTNITEDKILEATFIDGRKMIFLDEGRWNPDLQDYEFGNGSIAAIPEAGPHPTFIEVPYDGSQSFRITADEFYLINSIQVINLSTGEVDQVIPVTNLYTMDVTLTNITEDKILEATFIDGRKMIFLDEGRWNPDLQDYEFGNGSIAAIPEAGPHPTFIEVPYDGSQSFRITADEFYLIDSIQVLNLSTGEVDQVIPVTDLYTMDVTLTNITDDKILEATFIDGRKTVLLDEGRWNPDLQDYEFGNGSITAIPVTDPTPGPLQVPYDGSQSFRITADEFYLINSIQVINLSTGEVDEVIPVTDLYTMDITLTNITEDIILEATFIDGRKMVFMETGQWNPDLQAYEFDNGMIEPLPIPEFPSTYFEVPYDGTQTFRVAADEFYLIDTITVIYPHSEREPTPITVTDHFSMEVTVENITEDIILQATFKDGRNPVYVTIGEWDTNLQEQVKDEGSVTPDGMTLVPYNGSITYTITPDEFYMIESITVYQNGATESIEVSDPFGMEVTISNVVGITDLDVKFKDGRNPVYVTIGEWDTNLQEQVKDEGSVSPDGMTLVPYDGSITFTITPDEFYLIESITVYQNDATETIEVSDPFGMEVTISNVVGITDLDVKFKDGRNPVYVTIGEWDTNLQEQVKDEGSVSPDGMTLVPYDGSITFTITPDEFYLIESITVYQNGATESIEVSDAFGMEVTISNVVGITDLDVKFKDGRNPVYVTIGEWDTNLQEQVKDEGSVSPDGMTLVPFGGSQTFTVTPDPGFKIETITVYKSQDSSTDEIEILDAFGMSFSVDDITDLVDVEVKFVEHRPSILSLAIGEEDPDTGVILPAQGSITPEGNLNYLYGSAQTFSIVPNAGYKISSLKIDDVSQAISDSEKYSMDYTFENITGDHVIAVSFSELPHTVLVSSNGSGTATASATKVDIGDSVTVSMNASEGYVVDKVSVNGEISNISGEQTSHDLVLTVDGDMEVTAFFRKASVIQHGMALANSGSWTTIETGRAYNSMVVVTTPVTTTDDPTFCIRVDNVTASSFDVLVSRLDGSSDVISNIPFTYFIAEEGVYTEAEDGISMEAVKYNSTVTDRKGSWKGQARSYQNTYTSPVVLGQVMTANDDAWSVFWSKGSATKYVPDSGSLFVGKHVGEDPDNSREDETVGYMVFEKGSYIFNGTVLQAEVGGDIVNGVQNGGKIYTNLPDSDYVVASQSAMDGGDGGFAVLLGDHKPQDGSLLFAIQEDLLKDSERKHTSEQIAWLALKEISGTTAVNDNFSIESLIASGNVIENDYINENVSVRLKTDVISGELLFNPDGSFSYVSDNGQPDSFEYEMLDTAGQVVSSGSVQLN